MKKIILASGSPQRKKLLNLVGIPFTIHPSHKEEKSKITSSCAQLVKDNALIKARDVAAQYDEGIVIGCDTVGYVGNKEMLGKPKDLKDAKRMLKKLMSRPQWIYSGLAVIDAKTKKELVDFEKTKVFMDRLTDKEIDEYHKRMCPLDKAGSFDIEGLGSLFIHRVEGCYFNVIGMPMAKLHKMLKKMGVHVLSVLCAFGLIGCSSSFNLATQQEETLLYSTEREISIGDKVAAKIAERYDFVEDVEMNARVQKIFDRIVAVSDRRDVIYYCKIIDEDIMNAVSLPGGYIYLFKGLIDNADNDDQIAGVIAHEIGHITARHGIKRLQASHAAMIAQIAATQVNGNVAGGVGFAITALFLEHSQQDEFESDRLAVKYMRKAGYNPKGMVEFLEKLKEESENSPMRQYSYWKTHPGLAKRIAVVNQEMTGKMEFKDYLNLTGEDF